MQYSLIEDLGLAEEYRLVAHKNKRLVYAHTVYYEVEEPDYEQFETENDEPVDNIFSEIQQRLLINPLFLNLWTKRDFWASANVGIYYALDKPPVVPDMFLSFDVKKPKDWFKKENKCYYTWKAGKSPELVVELISNKVGKEDKEKMQIYAQMGVLYYILVDPHLKIYPERLNVFILDKGKYTRLDKEDTHFYMPEIELGILIWDGLFELEKAPWARWCNKEGNVLFTGAEKSLAEEKRAEEAKKKAEKEREKAEEVKKKAEEERIAKEKEQERAEKEKERADKLLAKLLELGLSPDELE